MIRRLDLMNKTDMNGITIHRTMMWILFAFAIVSAVAALIEGAWWHIATPFLFMMIGMWYRDLHKQIDEEEDP